MPNNEEKSEFFVFQWITGVLFFRPWLASFDFSNFSFLDRRKLVGSEVILETTIMGYVDILLTVILFYYIFKHRLSLSKIPMKSIIVSFVIFVSINATVLTIDPSTSIRKLSKVYLYFGHLCFFFLLSDDKYFYRLLRAILVSLIFPLVYGWFDYIANADLNLQSILLRPYREYSTFTHANSYAFFLSGCIFVALALYYHEPIQKTKYKIVIAISFITMLTTGARMAFAALIISLIISLTKSFSKILIYSLVLILLLLNVGLYSDSFNALIKAVPSLMVGDLSVGLQIASTEMLAISGNETTVSEFAVRLLIWGRLIEGLGNNFLWGMGLFSSNKYMLETFNEYYNPHNDYVRLFFELGVIGLVLYFGLFVILYKKIYRVVAEQDRDEKMLRALIAFIPYMFIVSLTDNLFLDTSFGLILFCLMGYFLKIVSKSDNRNSLNSSIT